MKRKISYLLGLLLLLAVACTTVKDSDDYRKLAAEKASLEEQIRARDREIEEITSSMNKVDSNLMAISEYVEVMDGIKLSELVKQRGEVDLMISEIGDYVKENNEIVQELEKKVQESTNMNEGLRRLVDQQKREVGRKEEQITQLLQRIAALEEELKNTVNAKDAEIMSKNAELTLKNMELNTQQKKIEEKETTLNTGYVSFGNKQELSGKGVIQSEGGLGLSKVILSNKFDNSDFQAVNIKEVAEIDIGVTKKQKALTQHPVDSYYFVKTDGRTYLKIVDYQKFWSISKYLVVLIDN